MSSALNPWYGVTGTGGGRAATTPAYLSSKATADSDKTAHKTPPLVTSLELCLTGPPSLRGPCALARDLSRRAGLIGRRCARSPH